MIFAEDIADRDAIPVRFRTEGLVLVYVESNQTFYYLAGGITNAHWLALGNSVSLNIRHESTDFNFTTADDIVIFDTALNDTVTGTLFTAVGNDAKQIKCKNNGVGRLAIALNGTETLDGESDVVYFDVPMISFTIVSDGTNWFIL